MRKMLIGLVVAGSSLVLPATAFAAGTPKVVHTYEVVSGTFTKNSTAATRLSKLTAAGFTKFVILHKNKQYLVEEGPETATQAKTEQAALKAKGFKSTIVRIK